MVGVSLRCCSYSPVSTGLALLLWQALKKDFVHSRHGTSPSAQTQVDANGTTSDKIKTEQYDYDFFGIGGGTGGVRAARWSAMNFGGSQFPALPCAVSACLHQTSRSSSDLLL